MNNALGILLDDLRKLWGGLSNFQRSMIILLTMGAFAAISFIIVKSSEPEWGVLYSDLTQTDAAAIVENLKKGGYRFKLSDDNKTILVPMNVKEELRLEIAQEDIIQDSNPGFELLNKMQFGATDFQNKLTRQRIFQDELTRTIEKIRGIKKARVQIAEPDRSVFSDKDELPSASVMLILDGGVRIKTDQVKAIKNLVAYGIPRLTPDRVFVTDQNGISLSDEIDKSSSGITDYRTEFEAQTADKVQKVLQKIVGQGNVSVEVSAVINFDRAKSTIEKYDPTGVVASENEEAEIYDKSKKQDISEEPAQEEGAETTQETTAKKPDYQKTKTSKDYKVSKEIKQVVYAPGKVERMTIAVALNRILTSREKEEIKNLAISASGADLTRGDIITVSGMQFASTLEEENKPLLDQIDKMSIIETLLSQVAPLVVVLILGITALLVLKSLLKKPLEGEEVYEGSRQHIRIAGDDNEHDMIEAAPPMPAIEANLDPVLEKMRGEINSTIIADPEQAARLLQAYIKD